MTLTILSLQSHVAYGHVGNTAAVFPLQLMGIEVWPVHTVQFSNHTGYGAWRGMIFDAQLIADVVEGIADRGVLQNCQAVLSGYMGSAAIGHTLAKIVTRVKSANPSAIYCCDPVMGDVGRGVFVHPDLPRMIRDTIIPQADIITPNHFEFDLLVGKSTHRRKEFVQALHQLHQTGPRIIMVTSVHVDDTPDEAIDCIASDATHIWRVRTPKLALSINGAGDTIAALFAGHFLIHKNISLALSHAVSATYGLLDKTLAAGSREILTVAAQGEFVRPSRMFAAENLSV